MLRLDRYEICDQSNKVLLEMKRKQKIDLMICSKESERGIKM